MSFIPHFAAIVAIADVSAMADGCSEAIGFPFARIAAIWAIRGVEGTNCKTFCRHSSSAFASCAFSAKDRLDFSGLGFLALISE
ncbi:MAG: hypothetical protein WCF71_00125 [Verrucomicrobiia bacterium]